MGPTTRRLLALVAALAVLALALVLQPESDEPRGAAGTATARPSTPGETRPALRAPEQDASRETAPSAEGLGGLGGAPESSAGPGAAGLLHGILLDAATDEPVPGAAVQLPGQARDADLPLSDAEGRFEALGTLGPGDTVRILDPTHGTHIRDVRAGDVERLADGTHLLRFAVGPTQRFLLPAGSTGDATDWELRLARVTEDDHVETGPWAPGRDDGASPSAPGWMRYDNPLRWPAPDAGRTDAGDPRATRTLWLEARRRDGTLHAAAEARSTVGVSPDVAELSTVASLASLSGRVVDGEGEPIESVSVLALPAGEPEDAEAWPSELSRQRAAAEFPEPLSLHEALRERRTDEDGRFLLTELTPGAWQLFLVHHRTRSPGPREVHVAPGRTDLGDLRLDLPRIAGELRGVLRSETGGMPPYLHVHLRAQDGTWEDLDTAGGGGRFQHDFATGRLNMDGPDVVRELTFVFQTVPVGSYALRVVDPTGARWSPAELVVTAPADELVFQRIQDDGLRSLVVDASDATTGKLLPQVDVRIELDGRELAGRRIRTGEPELEVPRDAGLLVIVSSPGYRLRVLEQDDLLPEPGPDGELLRARVALEPGWSARVEVLDCGGELDVLDLRGTQLWIARGRHRAVAGVQAFEDGKPLGTSDADGLLRLELDAPPRALTIRAEGYRLLGSRRLRDGLWEPDAREGVVWLLRR